MIRTNLLSEAIAHALAPLRWPLSEAERREIQGQLQLERLMRAFCQSASDEVMKMLAFMDAQAKEALSELDSMLGTDRE